MNTSIKHHEFKAEWVEDEHGPAVMLTQSDEGYSEPQTVLVHPWQLQAVCERFHILPSGDAQTSRTVAALTRRLVALAERIGDLREYVAKHSDHEHADLHVEMVMLNAASDLADEWAREAADWQHGSGTNAPDSGSIEREKRGHSADALDGSNAQPSLL